MRIAVTGLATLFVLAASPASVAEYVVEMKSDGESGAVYFEPNRLEIKSGDTVTWLQDDAANEHNVVAYPDGIPPGVEPFQAPMLTALGQSWSYTFTESGSYRYHCHPHEALGMRGEIIVDRESRPEEFAEPQPGEMEHGHADVDVDADAAPSRLDPVGGGQQPLEMHHQPRHHSPETHTHQEASPDHSRHGGS